MPSSRKTSPWNLNQFDPGDAPDMHDWNNDNLSIVAALTEVGKSASKPPYVGENLNFWIYDAATKMYIDSGIRAPGPVGPATEITIGTVERGEEAAATITGAAPNQVLNLVLPKGDDGPPGTGTGYMKQADYDPTGKNADAFDMDNMVESADAKIMTEAEREKLQGIEAGATNYQHPTNHEPSIITQNENNRFVTDAEKATWNGKQEAMTAGVDYIAPATIAMTGNYGVFTGGIVTAQSTPNQTVAVSAGSVITPEGKTYAFSAVPELAASAADATNPRIDIVYVTSAGVVTYLEGIAAASPTQPSMPANGTILAAITRAANDNTIATGDIADRRDFMSTLDDFENVFPVTESANVFACNFEKKHTRNFSFLITNTTAKTVTFTNVPYGTCDSIITIKSTATATVTWTLGSPDGIARLIEWPAGAPTLTAGYTYEILFSFVPILGKWIGRAQLGAAN